MRRGRHREAKSALSGQSPPSHLTEPSECQTLVDPAVRQYGRIDVLFNNAAMAYFNWLEDITNEGDLRGLIDPAFFSPARRGRISRPAMRVAREQASAGHL